MIAKEKMDEIIAQEAEKAVAGSGYDEDDLISRMKDHASVWEMDEDGARQFFRYYFTDMVNMLEAEENEDH